MRNWGILLVIAAFLFIAPQTVRADFFVHPLTFMFYNPPLMFVLNYIVNAGVFALGSFLFIRKTLKSTSKKKFLIAILILTGLGVFADLASAIFLMRWVANMIPQFILTFFLLAIFTYLVARYYLKAPAKGAIFVGILMGILTNPYILFLNYGYSRIYPSGTSIQLVSGYCTGGNTANVLIRNLGTSNVILDDITVIDTSTGQEIEDMEWTSYDEAQSITELEPGEISRFATACEGYCTYRFIYGGAVGTGTQTVSVAC